MILRYIGYNRSEKRLTGQGVWGETFGLNDSDEKTFYDGNQVEKHKVGGSFSNCEFGSISPTPNFF